MKKGDVLAERYRLIDRLGVGGMGEVWRAEQMALGRDVALKLVRAELSALSAEVKQRFAREAALVAKVEHRNVVDILDYGTCDANGEGTQYLVMPLLNGESLQERLQKGDLRLDELLGWIDGVLAGLCAIHAAGIVHRDLKPANVFLARDADGVIPKLLDFGISRADTHGTDLTARGSGMGTPQYMAPEQFESAKDVDASADVWGVGAILYEALAGRRPYEGEDAFAIYKAVLSRPPTSLSKVREDLPAALVAFVGRALEREPGDRFRDGAAMREAFDALLASEELPKRLLAECVTAGARVPRTAQMSKNSVPVSGDAPTEPARILAETPPTVALRESEGTEKGPTARTSPLVWLGVVLAVAGVGWLVYDVLRTVPSAIVSPPGEERVEAVAPAEEGDAAVEEHVASGPSGYLVSEPLELAELVFMWADLGESARAAAVRFVERGDRYVALVPSTTEADRLATFGEGFGVSRTPSDWDPRSGLRPRLLQTTVRLSLHLEPDLDSTVSRVLPHHSVVVALDPADREDASPEAGSVRRVLAAVGIEGWVSARFLEPLEGCVPRLSIIRDDLGREFAAAGSDGWVAARTHAYLDGRRQPVFMVQGSDLARRESVVRVYRLRRGCAVEPIVTHRVAGVLSEAFLTETIPRGGRTLLVTSVTPVDTGGADGMRLWEARPLDGGPPIWSARLASGADLPSRARDSVVGTRDRIARGRRAPFALSLRRAGEERRWLVYRDGAIVDEVAGAESESESESESE